MKEKQIATNIFRECFTGFSQYIYIYIYIYIYASTYFSFGYPLLVGCGNMQKNNELYPNAQDLYLAMKYLKEHQYRVSTQIYFIEIYNANQTTTAKTNTIHHYFASIVVAECASPFALPNTLILPLAGRTLIIM